MERASGDFGQQLAGCTDVNCHVLETEQVVTGDAVPKAVLDTATKHMPKGAKAGFEIKSIVLYSVEAMVNGKEIEILVDPAGRLMELESDDDHEHGEHEHDEAVEKVVKLAETPAAVQSALKKAAGGATIDEIEMETEDGVTIYEASWKVSGVEHEVSVDTAGHVLETEQVVIGDAVPKAVRNAATKHMPKGAKSEFEIKSIVFYSVEAMVNGKEVEILVDPAGRLMELKVDDDHEHGQHGDHDDDEEDEEDDD